VQRIIYDHPLVHGLLRRLSGRVLKWRGWQFDGPLPPEHKFIAILAGHTSNWDFTIGLSLALHYRVRVFWIGKNTIFRPPFNGLMRWLGGIPVDRDNPGAMVADLAAEFARHDNFVLAIAPEGTRSKVDKWKSGFYRIAEAADAPVVLAYLDYARKVGGIGPTIYPSGDADADIAKMQAFYDTVTSKYPDKSTSSRR